MFSIGRECALFAFTDDGTIWKREQIHEALGQKQKNEPCTTAILLGGKTE